MRRQSGSFPLLDPGLVVGLVAATLLILSSGKTILWLPLLSATVLLLSLVKSRKEGTPVTDFPHPVGQLPLCPNLNQVWSRWVSFKKVIGGDSIALLPDGRSFRAVFLDLSKNDLETLIHFLWIRSTLVSGQGRSGRGFVRQLEPIRRLSRRVEVSYLIADARAREGEFYTTGPFLVAFGKGLIYQTAVLPQGNLLRRRWRGASQRWLVATDGLLPYHRDIAAALTRHSSFEEWIRTLQTADDVTVCWWQDAIEFVTCKWASESPYCLRRNSDAESGAGKGRGSLSEDRST